MSVNSILPNLPLGLRRNSILRNIIEIRRHIDASAHVNDLTDIRVAQGIIDFSMPDGRSNLCATNAARLPSVVVVDVDMDIGNRHGQQLVGAGTSLDEVVDFDRFEESTLVPEIESGQAFDVHDSCGVVSRGKTDADIGVSLWRHVDGVHGFDFDHFQEIVIGSLGYD